MITITELTKTWTSISAQQGQTVGRRADNQHPLDIFITYDENCSMQMLMLSDFLPNMPRSSREIIVRTNPRNDGRYALCFVLADENLREQFICLCWDIMDYTFSSSNKSVGIKSALKRFSMWQKLFAENKDKKLSEAEIKGLIGELLTLKEAVKSHICSVFYIGVASCQDLWYNKKDIICQIRRNKIVAIINFRTAQDKR